LYISSPVIAAAAAKTILIVMQLIGLPSKSAFAFTVSQWQWVYFQLSLHWSMR
jgi:hypothetical protein